MMTPQEMAAHLLDEFCDEKGELIPTRILTSADSPYAIGDTCLVRLRCDRSAIMSGEIVHIVGGHELEFLVRPLVPGWEHQLLVGGLKDIAIMGLYP